MIQIRFNKNVWGYFSFIISTDEGDFQISFAGNLDLYFLYMHKGNILDCPEAYSITITKENEFLYNLFDKLYLAIKSGNPFINVKQDFVEELYGNPENLFKNESIDWYSDECYYEIASRLIIKQEKDKYIVTFVRSKEDEGVNFLTYAVRISTSGSRYGNYFIPFMEMYKELVTWAENAN